MVGTASSAPIGTRTRCEDGHHLPGGALGVVGPVDQPAAGLRAEGLVEHIGAADEPRELHRRSTRPSRVSWGVIVASTRSGLGVRDAELGLTGGGVDRGERPDTSGMLDGHGLGDHPTHGRAQDVGRLDVEASSRPMPSAAMSASV